MATYEHNALMQFIDEKGNVHINYPATKAENVTMGNSNAQNEITARAKTSDVLYTLEEISACTDFTNKISGAEAVNEVNQNLNNKTDKTWTALRTIGNSTSIYDMPSGYSEYLVMFKTQTIILSTLLIPAEAATNDISIKYVTDDNVTKIASKTGNVWKLSDYNFYLVIFAR